MSNILLLPGDPGFTEILTTPPPNWRETAARDGDTVAFICEPGSGIFRPATHQDWEEYFYGGEYDERLAEIADDEAIDGE